MRQIKFRGKRTVDGKWVTGYFWKAPDTTNYIREIKNNSTDHLVFPDSVGQIIPYPYSREKDLYSGDLVNCLVIEGKYEAQVYYRSCLIEWDELNAVIYLDGRKELMSSVRFLDMDLIGNIHESKN